MSCVNSSKPDASKAIIHGLRLHIRELKNELADLASSMNSCGQVDDCSVIIMGVTSGTTTTAVTWSSFSGFTYKVESSITQETWNVLADSYPAQGELTTFNIATPSVVTYYRVTENPLNPNTCT